MKILNWYIIRSFFAPYIISFLIAEFILVMQFMWKYIDDLAGKGLGPFDFMELLMYYSVMVIPMAVPITILLSSVMVYGALGEKYELMSMKTAGISLNKIMFPGFMIAILTFAFSLFVSNYMKPKAGYKFFQTFTALKAKKPTLNIQEKIFNNDFEGVTIQVNKKHRDGRNIEGIKIYNVKNRAKESYNVITAKRGEIYTNADNRFFIMRLYDGNQYIEQKESSIRKGTVNTYPLVRYRFDTLEKAFDLSHFYDDRSGSFFSKRRDVMNSVQLITEIDTFSSKINAEKKNFRPKFAVLTQSVNKDANPKRIYTGNKLSEFQRAEAQRTYSNVFDQFIKKDLREYDRFIEIIDSSRQYELMNIANENLVSQKHLINHSISNIRSYREYRDYWELGLHQQYSWALICVVFLFIGAPLGSIIRKGGYGVPVLVAITFFMAFILLSILGEKMNKASALNPVINAWMPVIVLLPISVYITIKAYLDSKILFLRKH